MTSLAHAVFLLNTLPHDLLHTYTRACVQACVPAPGSLTYFHFHTYGESLIPTQNLLQIPSHTYSFSFTHAYNVTHRFHPRISDEDGNPSPPI